MLDGQAAHHSCLGRRQFAGHPRTLADHFRRAGPAISLGRGHHSPDEFRPLHVAKLVASERPLILVGWGTAHHGLGGDLAAIAEHLSPPVVSTIKAISCLPATHPLLAGHLGPGQRSDLVPFLRSYDRDVIVLLSVSLEDFYANGLCVTGDGSMLMHGSELSVAAEHGVDLLVLVFNNRSHGRIRLEQQLEFDGDLVSISLPDIDFAQWMSAMGIPSFTVSKPEDVDPVLRQPIEQKGAVGVEICCHRTRTCMPAQLDRGRMTFQPPHSGDDPDRPPCRWKSVRVIVRETDNRQAARKRAGPKSGPSGKLK